MPLLGTFMIDCLDENSLVGGLRQLGLSYEGILRLILAPTPQGRLVGVTARLFVATQKRLKVLTGVTIFCIIKQLDRGFNG